MLSPLFTASYATRMDTHHTGPPRLTFCVHGYSNGGLKAFVMHQTLDRDVFQQPRADSQGADDQGGTVGLWDQCGHWGANCAVVPLHVPHYLRRRPWHGGAVGLDYSRWGSLVAHLRFRQHWGAESDTMSSTNSASSISCVAWGDARETKMLSTHTEKGQQI